MHGTVVHFTAANVTILFHSKMVYWYLTSTAGLSEHNNELKGDFNGHLKVSGGLLV